MFQAATGMGEMYVLSESRTLKFEPVAVFEVQTMILEANYKLTIVTAFGYFVLHFVMNPS